MVADILNMPEQEKNLEIGICRGMHCVVAGNRRLWEWCSDLKSAGLDIDARPLNCAGYCEDAPVVIWNQDQWCTRAKPSDLTRRLIEEQWFSKP